MTQRPQPARPIACARTPQFQPEPDWCDLLWRVVVEHDYGTPESLRQAVLTARAALDAEEAP